jgi:hypothetical protein
LAVNSGDGRVYTKTEAGTVQEVTRQAASTSANRVQLAASTGALADDADFTFNPATDQLNVSFLEIAGNTGETTIKRLGHSGKVLNITQQNGGAVKIGDVAGERDGTLFVVEDGTATVQVISATLKTETIRVGGALYGLQLADGDGSHHVEFKAPATVSANVTLTLPATAGSADQVLTTNGSGTLSWTTPSGGGGASVPDFLLFSAGII